MVSKPVTESTPEFQIQQEDFPALPGAQSELITFIYVNGFKCRLLLHITISLNESVLWISFEAEYGFW